MLAFGLQFLILKGMSEFRRRLMMGKNGQSPTDYITNGLVFHLDGADFNGTTWVDKVGHIEYTKVGTNITKSGDGVNFTGETGNYLYATSKPTTPYNATTIEVVLKYDGGSSWGIVYNTDNLDYIMYGIVNGRVSYRMGANRTTKTAGTVSTIFTHSISNTHNYFNGESKGTAATASWRNPAEYSSVVGAVKRSSFNAEYCLNGTLYQLRMYNRILTEAEILHNANIDAQKYNITL